MPDQAPPRPRQFSIRAMLMVTVVIGVTLGWFLPGNFNVERASKFQERLASKKGPVIPARAMPPGSRIVKLRSKQTPPHSDLGLQPVSRASGLVVIFVPNGTYVEIGWNLSGFVDDVEPIPADMVLTQDFVVPSMAVVFRSDHIDPWVLDLAVLVLCATLCVATVKGPTKFISSVLSWLRKHLAFW